MTIRDEWEKKRKKIQTAGLDKDAHAELLANRRPYWIRPDGEVVDLQEQDMDHARSAMNHLMDRGIGADPEGAIRTLIGEGWLRVQAYLDSTAFIQGSLHALRSHGDRILEIVPGLKAVEIAYVPSDYKSPPSVTREELDRMGWAGAVSHVKAVGKFGTRARRF